MLLENIGQSRKLFSSLIEQKGVSRDIRKITILSDYEYLYIDFYDKKSKVAFIRTNTNTDEP